MHDLPWAEAVQQCERADEPYALVTILGCAGSTPRDTASKMVITAVNTFDTIGGGNLEFSVMQAAREKIAQNKASIEIIPFPLGGALGQCCGGNATVLIETFPSRKLPVTLFGAGHVAKALISILSGLPYRVTWIDGRQTLFPNTTAFNITPLVCQSPVEYVPSIPSGAAVIILTHNHPLDYALAEALLRQTELTEMRFRYIGLIGSDTKAKRFRKRLMSSGFDETHVNQIRCPIGLSAVPGKLPMEVAVSIAGELIALHRAAEARQKQKRQGLAWTDIKNTFATEGLS